jgi:hypothetical protein
MGFWWAAVPKERWPDHPEWVERLGAKWVPGWGDRRQELVFIGNAMDEGAIRAALDDCLIGPEQPDAAEASAWQSLPDPFPAWGQSDAA